MATAEEGTVEELILFQFGAFIRYEVSFGTLDMIAWVNWGSK